MKKFVRKGLRLFKLGLGICQIRPLLSYFTINVIACDAFNVKIGLFEEFIIHLMSDFACNGDDVR